MSQVKCDAHWNGTYHEAINVESGRVEFSIRHVILNYKSADCEREASYERICD